MELGRVHKMQEMNIVFHRYKSICEPDYIEAFESLGIHVIDDSLIPHGSDINSLVENIGKLVIENHPMFVFSINFFPYISIVCEKLGVKYVCVSVDCPVMEIFNTAIRNKCNRVFLFDHQQYLSVRDENPECIFHLPLGAATARIDRTIGTYTTETDHDYLYDLSFVGSLYNEKDPLQKLKLSEYYAGLLDGMIAAQRLFPGLELIEETVTDELVSVLKESDPGFYPSDLSVRNMDRYVAINNYISYHLTYTDRLWLLTFLSNNMDGYRMHLFTQSDTGILRHSVDSNGLIIHGGVNSLSEMPEVFRRSKINLNHTMRSIKTGLPQRIWDVLGSGGFLITNNQAEISEYLEPGRHLETYDTTEELYEKIRYYLSHDDERERIALAGYEFVKQNHQVLHRVMEMIKAIQ